MIFSQSKTIMKTDKPASHIDRFIAAAIDTFIFTALLFSLSSAITDVYLFLFLVLLAVFGYYVYPTSKYGQTLGKKAKHIKVITTQGKLPSLGRTIFREAIGKSIARVFGIGFFWILIDEQHRGWHDLLAGTLVVTIPKEESIRAHDTHL